MNLSVSGAVAQDVPEMAKQLVKMVIIIIIMIMLMIVMMILPTGIKIMMSIVSKVSEYDLVRVVN